MNALPILPFAVRAASILVIGMGAPSFGHDLEHPDDPHPHYDWLVKPPETVVISASGTASAAGRPAQAASFDAFAPKVKVHWDEKFFYVESDGLPEHNMMVGITNWQQQVPLPQDYFGANAWRFPRWPVPAETPQTIKGHFLRGAIAIAVNGIPIFNPQNNRGEIAAEIGELDQWGGHCGRADDYHYHAAPLHLQAIVGKGNPIAYALDGYPIYGLTEPDGTPPVGLDEFDGHTTPALGYHYHASMKYPYVNGGFHGEVAERGGQVDPQPELRPLREALPPLRGAVITGFESAGTNGYKLTYELNGEKRAVVYTSNAPGRYSFAFLNGSDGASKKTYSLPPGGGAGHPPEPPPAQTPGSTPSAATSSFILTSPEVKDGGALPVDYTGDGSAATLPLAWSGAPAGTKSYALIMHHLDPEGKVKWYWTLYNIPADVTALPKNVKGVGTLGSNSVNPDIGYAPPHSKGPGPKTYVLTLYALSSPLEIDLAPAQVNRESLLAAMKGKILASAELHVVYSKPGDPGPPPRP
ncbi:YHYH protein [soil metagenome]